MVVYFMRHGLAERGGPGRPDRERVLTSEGVERVRRQAAALERIGWPLERIVSSPLRRARQTADLVAGVLGLEVEEDELLACGSRLGDVVELCSREPNVEHWLFVGHQPDLGTHVYQLTGANVAMREGTIAVVQAKRLRPAQGRLVGLYDPEVLAALG